MRRISLFAEDFGHEAFLDALLKRLSRDCDIAIEISPRSVRGGHGKVISELEQFLNEIEKRREALPDLLVVATDANCHGLAERRREVEAVTGKYTVMTVCAVPDPHIERWFLLDSAAFKAVLGRGCSTPDQKCERDRYKKLLIDAVLDAGIVPLLGGIEHAEDLVNQMDTDRAAADVSFGHLLTDLRAKFNEWRSGEQ